MRQIKYTFQHENYAQDNSQQITLEEAKNLVECYNWDELLERTKDYAEVSDDVHQPTLQFFDGDYNLLITPTKKNIFDVVAVDLPILGKSFLGVSHGPSVDTVVFKHTEKKELSKFISAFFENDYEFFYALESEPW